MKPIEKIIRGQLICFGKGTLEHVENAALVIDNSGRIAWRGRFGELPKNHRSLAVTDYGQQLLLPGFVDAHIHFPQYRMLAAPAVDLLDWLHRYTFPEEARYGDEGYAATAAERFLNRLFTHGTTSAMAFCSVHRQCANALFSAAEKFNMALVTGKTMMDRNAIPAVEDTADQGAKDSSALYKKWHNKARLRYAVTPRFAITSSEAQLKASGELLKSLPGALMQTHISESVGEIAMIKQLFPNSRDYTDVYDQFGLLSDRSLFAHGIHLSDRECARMSESGSTVVHCPTSNAFLGSGIMSFQYLSKSSRPVAMGLATDIGGGTSYSMLATMAESYKLQMLIGHKPAVAELFYVATQGNADRLKIGNETGSLEKDKFADVIVLNPEATPVLKSRQEVSQSIEDVLFSLMMLGDDRAVTSTYVAGSKVS